MIRIMIAFILTLGAFSQEILKEITTKNGTESLQLICEDPKMDCSILTIRLKNKSGRKKLISYDDNYLLELMSETQIEKMNNDKYKVFATLKSVCELGHAKSNRACAMNILFSLGVFASSGVISDLANDEQNGFDFKTAAIGGGASSLLMSTGGSPAIVQFVLFAPAIAVDIFRLFTVMPIKKIIQHTKAKRVQKHLIPALEELYDEMQIAQKDDFDNDLTFDQAGHRKIEIPKGQFKLLKKVIGELK